MDRRSGLTGLLIIAISAAALAAVWLGLEQAEGVSVSDRVTALAATAQALTAAIIVLLTLQLSRTAQAALKAAQREAEAAATAAEQARVANHELRVERELNVMPLLTVGMTHSWQPDGSLGLQIDVENVSSHPALRVTTILLRGPWDGRLPMDPWARDGILRDSPGRLSVVAPGAKQHFGWNIQGADVLDSMLVRVEYGGWLGGTVWETFELQHDEGRRPHWRELQRYLQPSVHGAEPIIR